MKIFEVIPQLNSGGAERFTVDLCNELLKMDYDVTLIILFPLDTHGFYISELNSNIRVISFNKKKGLNIIVIYKLLKLILWEKPDFVHSHLNAFYYLVLSMLFKRKVKFFHTVHNDALFEAPGRMGIIIKKALIKINFFTPITISNKTNLSFNNHYGLSSNVIYNGRSKICKTPLFDEVLKEFCLRFRISENTKVFVNIARLASQKNHFLLVNTFNELVKNGYDVSLLIIGAPIESEIYDFILKNNPENRIFYLGEKKNPIDYLLNADAFCLSSIHEGMPITLIEALTVGCIPICTPAGGISDMLIDGENGFISKNFEKIDFYDCFVRYLNMNNSSVLKLKQNIISHSEIYNISNCAVKYNDLFNLSKVSEC